MAAADRHAPIRFLQTLFEPTDWVAIFLKSYERSTVAQRVGPVSWVQSERFQRWLRAMNAGRYNVFVSVNAIASGRRSRTRDAIGAVRHVFLDADHDGPAVLSRIEARRDLPSPSYVLHSSPNHVHVFWRVRGFDRDSVERLQKQLARELQTDPAATPVTQNTRLPGFFNHKRAQPHLVTIEYRNVDVRYGPEDFPPVEERLAWPQSVRPRQPRNSMSLPSSGRSGISLRCRQQLLASTATSTRFASAAGSSRGFALDDDQALDVLSEWNARCSRRGPPTSCSTSFIVPPGTAASQLAGCFDAASPPDSQSVRVPAGIRSSQVSPNSRVHRSTSTDFSVTAHALIEPMRPTLVRRYP